MDIVFIFILGSIVGSFLNVCIVRLPQGKSVIFPASHCPHCQKPIAWVDNIPLLSWMLLRGRCRYCQGRIAFRYWLVEFLTAAIFVIFYIRFGNTAVLPAYLVMASCFVVAIFVDLSHRIIPDEVSVGGMWAGIILSALIPGLHPLENLYFGTFLAGLLVLVCLLLSWVYPFFCKHLMEQEEPYDDIPVKILVLCSLIFILLVNTHKLALSPFWDVRAEGLAAALIGFIVGGGAIYAMGLLGDMIFRKESMGGGDIKLMAMIGAFLGWKTALLGFFIAPFFGAIIGIIEKIRTKDSTIAYGPFLILGALVSLFWGEGIIQWIIQGGMYHL